MTTTEAPALAALLDEPPPVALTYRRTVDRTVVHRRNLAEVFLTDLVAQPDGRFSVGAQLPAAHPYYADHVAGHRLDPLLLLECCRQAETMGAHEVLRLALDTKFVLMNWAMDLDEQALAEPAPGPAELAIDVFPHTASLRGKEIRGMSYDMTMRIGAQVIGSTQLTVGYLPGTLYRAMRVRQRGDQPPSSDAFEAPIGVQLFPPYSVGRTDLRNVVVADRSDVDGELLARLLPPTTHPSMFDHALDHVPGMVLMEAARQLAVAATDEPRGRAARTVLTGLAAKFHHHTELDAPVELRARPGALLAPIGDYLPPQPVEVTVVQDGKVTADIAVTVSNRPGARR